jgi:hypothetical protein
MWRLQSKTGTLSPLANSDGVSGFDDFASGRNRLGVILAAAIPADQDQNSVGSFMIAERSVACADASSAAISPPYFVLAGCMGVPDQGVIPR